MMSIILQCVINVAITMKLAREIEAKCQRICGCNEKQISKANVSMSENSQ